MAKADDLLLVEGKALAESAIEHLMDEKCRANEFELMECPICLQICVHPSKLPCGHIFCFLCVKGLKNRRCAMCRTEFPIEFLERPELLLPINATASTSSAEKNEYQWFYKGRNGWWQYDERTCQEIEEAYKNDEKQCTILVAGYVYIVDFDQMLQQRQTDPSRKRQVKRDLATIPKKGVAGLRLPGSEHTAYVDDLSSQDGVEHTNGNSNLIATIAATEAAIRIASDIIDSTLAHADDHSENRGGASTNAAAVVASTNSNASTNRLGGALSSGSSGEGTTSDTNDEYLLNNSQLSNNSGSNSNISNNYAASAFNRRNMLDEIEETFNITNPSSINNSFRSTNHLDDFFSITLDEFKNLTMSNIADDSSSDDNNDDDDDTNAVSFNHDGDSAFTDQSSLRR